MSAAGTETRRAGIWGGNGAATAALFLSHGPVLPLP